MLHITNLSKQFGQTTIVNAVSFSLQYGDIGVLLGGSGVGKSTLLRCVAQLEPYESGTITIDGRPLQPQDVGMVFQQFNLFENLTVLDNLVLSLQWGHRRLPLAQARERAQDFLQRFAIADLASRYPHELSGGQKQRVALARTLSLEPKVVCLDEPTSALDPLLTYHVAQLINDIARQGYIVLVATHDTSLVKHMHGLLMLMGGGKIIEIAQSGQYAGNPALFPHLSDFLRHET